MVALNQHSFFKELQRLKEEAAVPAHSKALPGIRKIIGFLIFIRSARRQFLLTRALNEAIKVSLNGSDKMNDEFHQIILEALGIMKATENSPVYTDSKKLTARVRHNISLGYKLERIVRKRLYQDKPACEPSRHTKAVLSMAKLTFARQHESKRRLRG